MEEPPRGQAGGGRALGLFVCVGTGHSCTSLRRSSEPVEPELMDESGWALVWVPYGGGWGLQGGGGAGPSLLMSGTYTREIGIFYYHDCPWYCIYSLQTIKCYSL